jgi:Na+/H+ antiporter NhaC
MSDWFTLLPPVLAIVIVLWRKEVISALLVALFSAELIALVDGGSAGIMLPLAGLVNTLESTVAVMSDGSNARILMFSLLIGALLVFMRESGGVAALVNRLIDKRIASTPRRAGLLTYFTGIFVFIESNLSVLTAGILSRGLFDKFNMSRARLAYIIDSTSAPVCILILLNAWGAYVLGLISNYELSASPVSVLIGSIAFNFYAWFALALVLYTVLTGKVYGPMSKSEHAVLKHRDELSEEQIKPTKARFMLVPLLTLIVSMIGFMIWTGDGSLVNGSGSKSALYATVLACLVAYIQLALARRFGHRALIELSFKGMSELLPLVTIVLLSLALGASLRELGTGTFVASLISGNLPIFVVPALLFIAGAIISFTTGTSWGTFAILIPIGMPLVVATGIEPSLVLAAILGGGVFGDHASPISDTTAVSSVASGCDLLEHVETQMPYALTAAGLSIVCYLVAGFIWS